jgi:hypothetical protein
VAAHRAALEHPDQRAAQVVDVSRGRLVDPRGEMRSAGPAQRRQQEHHVDVEPRRAQHLHRRRDGVGEHAGEGRGHREAEPAGRGEGRQIEGSPTTRGQADRQIHRRDAMATPQCAGEDGFDGDRPQAVGRDEQPDERHHRDPG